MTQEDIKQDIQICKDEIKKLEKEIKALQKLCKHPSTTEMPYYWAPGHYSGQCKVCDDCGHVEHIPLSFPEFDADFQECETGF